MPRFVVFWTTSTIKDEKSAAKFHYIKSVSSKVVALKEMPNVVKISTKINTMQNINNLRFIPSLYLTSLKLYRQSGINTVKS